MTSKREMQKQIEALTKRLTYLENMHAKIEEVDTDNSVWHFFPMRTHERSYNNKIGRYNDRDLTSGEVHEVICNPHPYTREHTAHTCKISNITLQELAKFVIDKTPIKRAYCKSDRYEVIYDPDSTIKSVETDLGNIKITENNG